ncbi:phosphodiesterase [Novimethylophilus kurashikiensis]|uniref:Phosphodiesterase n=1 Tax=Novimethylophilus kurashikiensis TaxID=1825523 RepID=A0A2R5FCL6_9PROT|nr:HD-GYP domain-containing protein [Novimethylophilus kurashikiensis]GBG14673.1 phosphodiesterase [Novimethylophilus kurashikiensis]
MLKRINVNELRVGMYLQEFCGSWIDHPFWRSKFVIEDENDIRLVMESSIKEVVIDISKGFDIAVDEPQAAEPPPPQVSTAPIAEPPPPKPARDHEPTGIAEEMQRAAKICAQAKTAVKGMLQEVRMGKAIDAQAVGPLVEEISSSVIRNPGALISLARLKSADDYTYMHSVAVCALMVALGRQLGMKENDLREAGMAGLLHDIGKAVMPMDVLNKPGKLTDAEFSIIRGHPEAGYKLLKEGHAVSEVSMDVCLHHHEKVDGTGYPHGLKGDEISIFAKMGAVCDVYDAITSNRPYKAGWCPAESLRRMTEWSKGHFDGRVFQAFVKSVGIYPIGTLVKLKSGKLGVVVDQGEQSLLTPKVKAFFSSKSNMRILPEVIDTSIPSVQDKVAGIEDPKKWNFGDLSVLWGSIEAKS